MLNPLLKGVRIVRRRIQTQGIRTTALWAYARGIPKLTGVPMLAYSRVTPALYVGPQHRAAGVRTLARTGITHIVNMRAEFDDAAHGLTLDDAQPIPAQHETPQRHAAHASNPHAVQNERYCHLPTPDDEAPSAEHIAIGVEFIAAAIDGGGKVYVHCSAGVGRAPTMAAAYLLDRGYALDEALALIAAARPFIHITPPQLECLRNLEAMGTNSP